MPVHRRAYSLQRLKSAAAMKVMQDNVIDADLSGLTKTERLEYYCNVCEMLGLDPMILPLAYVTVDGGLRLAIVSERETSLLEF